MMSRTATIGQKPGIAELLAPDEVLDDDEDGQDGEGAEHSGGEDEAEEEAAARSWPADS